MWPKGNRGSLPFTAFRVGMTIPFPGVWLNTGRLEIPRAPLFPPATLGKGIFFPDFFPRALSRQRLFHSAFFPGLQEIRVAFYFSNDVFRKHFTFESAKRILNGFALLQSNFCHAVPSHPIIAIRVSDKQRFQPPPAPQRNGAVRRVASGNTPSLSRTYVPAGKMTFAPAMAVCVQFALRAFAVRCSSSRVCFRRAIFCLRFRLNLDLSPFRADT